MDLLNFSTEYGDLDLAFRLPGADGYDDLAPRTIRYELEGVVVSVADREDVIRSKTAAGCPKDLATLRELLEQRRRQT